MSILPNASFLVRDWPIYGPVAGYLLKSKIIVRTSADRKRYGLRAGVAGGHGDVYVGRGVRRLQKFVLIPASSYLCIETFCRELDTFDTCVIPFMGPSEF